MIKKILSLLVLFLFLPSIIYASDFETLTMPKLTEIIAKNKGKVVIINFFATWCPPCRIEIPDLVKAHQKYNGKDVVIIGLSIDEDKTKLPPFIKNMNIQYPIYYASIDIAKAYRVQSIPFNAIYAKDGNLVFSETGILDTEMLKIVFEKLL